jgi:hypothetical protein
VAAAQPHGRNSMCLQSGACLRDNKWVISLPGYCVKRLGNWEKPRATRPPTEAEVGTTLKPEALRASR